MKSKKMQKAPTKVQQPQTQQQPQSQTQPVPKRLSPTSQQQQQQQVVQTSVRNVQPVNRPSIVVANNITTTTTSGSFSDDQEVIQYKKDAKESVKQNLDFQKLLTLTLRPKSNLVKLSPTEDQLLPTILSLKVKEEEESAEESKTDSTATNFDRAPVDLVCVVDRSGSMAGEKIALVRDTLLQLLEVLCENDRLSIIQFDDQAQRLTKLARVTKENIATIFTPAIKQLKDNGGTDIAKGMDVALKVLKQRKFSNPVTSMFLLSDGQDGGADKKIQALMNNKLNADIGTYTLNTFGFGKDHDPTLMSNISSLKDGSFYFIDKLSQVDEAFIGALAGLLSVVCEKVLLEIEILQNSISIDVEKTYGQMWATVQNRLKFQIQMPQLIKGNSKDFVMELKIPKTAAGFKLQDNQREQLIVKAHLKATQISDSTIVEKQAEMRVGFCNHDEVVEIDEDGEVLENYFRVKSAQVMEDIMVMAEHGKNEEGKLVIDKLVNEMQTNKKVQQTKVNHLIQDLQKSKQYIEPQLYQSMGKHNLLNKKKAHMEQKAAILDECEGEEDVGVYANKMQKAMISQVKKSKKI